MAQMAYVEVALNIDMDWSTILMSLQTHMKPKILQRTLWLIEITTRNFVFCNLSYATKKSHMQLFWSYMQHVQHATVFSCIKQVAKDKISTSEFTLLIHLNLLNLTIH